MKSIIEEQLRTKSIPILEAFKSETNQLLPITFKESSDSTLPLILEGNGAKLSVENKSVAVLFSGGPASGGHNVVAGIYDVLGSKNTLYGVKAGPKGLIKGDLFKLTQEDISQVRNLGGFDLLGSDRTKIKTDEQFQAVRRTVQSFDLDAIIVIGGDDSNTNAAILADYLKEDKCTVVGVPKTIDGDLQVGHLLPISFGFDTATKIYAELVGNILQDTPSSRKYWHFIKLMGRSASHVTLEVALQTQPPVTFISEEISAKKWKLKDITNYLVDIILDRSSKGLNYGVVLIPEGLIENIQDFDKEIETLPAFIQDQLNLDRDSHGNLQVSQIATEELLIECVKSELSNRDSKVPFSTNAHFFGYEGRCGAPSAFDAAYTYNLGLVTGSLALNGCTGYMAAISDLNSSPKVLGIPLNQLIHTEHREGEDVKVIEKALVDLNSPAFKYFEQHRDTWAKKDVFNSPGPRQFWGPIANQLPKTVVLNQGYSSPEFNI